MYYTIVEETPALTRTDLRTLVSGLQAKLVTTLFYIKSHKSFAPSHRVA